MSNALDRNVTVGAFDGSPRTIVMTDNTQDLNDVQAIFQALVVQEVHPGGDVAAITTLDQTVSVSPESPSGVESVIAYITATGAPAVQALLLLTTDYTVSGKTITWVTDQTANTVVISYHPQITTLAADWRALFPRQ